MITIEEMERLFDSNTLKHLFIQSGNINISNIISYLEDNGYTHNSDQNSYEYDDVNINNNVIYIVNIHNFTNKNKNYNLYDIHSYDDWKDDHGSYFHILCNITADIDIMISNIEELENKLKSNEILR